jgi:hypothetical protein
MYKNQIKKNRAESIVNPNFTPQIFPKKLKKIMDLIDKIGIDMDKITAAQLAQIITIADVAYDMGYQATGAQLIDNNAVMINKTSQIIEF